MKPLRVALLVVLAALFVVGPGRPAELYRFPAIDFVNLRDKGVHSPF